MITNYTGTPRNLITEYGRLTVENIEVKIKKFIGQRYRQAQNSYQLLHCLTNPMTEAVHLNIVVEPDKYMYDGTPVGELILKLVMKKAVINTRATATHLRENLANLDTYIYIVN